MERMFEFLYRGLISVGTYTQSVLLLCIRLLWGWLFIGAGAAKLSNIGPVIDFFGKLGIPFPILNAYFVGSFELLGGICLLVGFGSRLFALPLAITMSVAMFTAHSAQWKMFFSNPELLIQSSPFTFFVAALIIFAFGPGLFSLDAILKRRYD